MHVMYLSLLSVSPNLYHIFIHPLSLSLHEFYLLHISKSIKITYVLNPSTTTCQWYFPFFWYFCVDDWSTPDFIGQLPATGTPCPPMVPTRPMSIAEFLPPLINDNTKDNSHETNITNCVSKTCNFKIILPR